MSRPARFSAVARREFILALQAMEHRTARERLRRQVEDAATLIGRRPFIGRVELALGDDRYRFWSISGFPYLLVYRPDFSPPSIIRFIHTARDLPSVLSALRQP